MVKLGDTVKWENTRTKEKLSGKIIGGEKGKNWKIEKGGKKYLVPKDRVKKGVVKKSEKKKVAPKKVAPKKTPTGQLNLDSLLQLGDLSAKIMGEKTKVNEKRKQKLEDIYFGDLEEASSRASKEQSGYRLKHHPDTSKETLINFILKKGLNVEKHLKDIDRENKEDADKRKKEEEAGIAKMEKQAKRGTLPFNKFRDYLDGNKRFDDEYDQRFSNLRENYSWGSDFYRVVQKITKRDVDTWSDLTETQQDKYYDIVAREVERDHRAYLKGLYDEVIKKKKFKSLKEAVDVFINKYENEY